jgi:hypothetical protein
MKTDTLKFKATVITLALTCATPALIEAATPGNNQIQPVTQVALKTISATINGTQKQLDLANCTENEFFEWVLQETDSAFKKIRERVKAFIDKNNKQSYDNYILSLDQLEAEIFTNFLVPLKQKVDITKAMQPGSNFQILLEKTYKIAEEMAYNELKRLIAVLKDHRKSPDVKKATALVGKLKPLLIRLTSIATFDTLEQKIVEASGYLPANTSTRVTQEIDRLKKLIKELKAESAATQGKVNLELFNVISSMLKRI